MEKLKELTKYNEDFEWYPTTEEIIKTIKTDLINIGQSAELDYNNHSNGIDYDKGNQDKPSILHIDSFLDVGTGDGRVFNHLTKEDNYNQIKIKNRYGIEKATLQGDNLVKNGIALLGRDFYETVLIDRNFTVVFSNPPYSEYKNWTIKLLKEVNAKFIYLVLPQRWKLDGSLNQLFNTIGTVNIVGSFDFTEAERAARAKVDLIKVSVNNQYDAFRSWVEEHIGIFEKNEDIPGLDDEENLDDSDRKWIKKHNKDTVKTMVENYKDDLQKILETFQALGKIDWRIISQLGVNKNDVIGKVRGDIQALKNRYWRLIFNHLEEITSRLTHNMRNKILEEIKWFLELDFNENNIRTIVIWVIENFNKYTRQQMLDAYDSITDFNNVRAYKSNDKWLDDNWRYTKPRPTKYSLDYRIVVHIGYQIYYSTWQKEEAKAGNPIEDLAIVARSLGFDNWGALPCGSTIITGEKYICHKKHYIDGSACRDMTDDILFEYRIYQNDNVHFKLNQEFLRVLNIEVGKERGWLKDPKHVQEEFDISQEEAIKYFTNNNLKTAGANDLLLLGV
jgi:hypothetical protein